MYSKNTSYFLYPLRGLMFDAFDERNVNVFKIVNPAAGSPTATLLRPRPGQKADLGNNKTKFLWSTLSQRQECMVPLFTKH